MNTLRITFLSIILIALTACNNEGAGNDKIKSPPSATDVFTFMGETQSSNLSITIEEDSEAIFADIVLIEPENDDINLYTFSASSNNTSLISDSSLTITGDSFEKQVSLFPNLHQTGIATISIVMTNTVTQLNKFINLSVNVTAVNDHPSVIISNTALAINNTDVLNSQSLTLTINDVDSYYNSNNISIDSGSSLVTTPIVSSLGNNIFSVKFSAADFVEGSFSTDIQIQDPNAPQGSSSSFNSETITIVITNSDSDSDNIKDFEDNCANHHNTNQADFDNDDQGDACDLDIDGDNYINSVDKFPTNPLEWSDSDNDSVGNNTDNCLSTSNPDQNDLDGDSIGDACDSDRDNDGASNIREDYLGTNPDNPDTDGDGILDGVDNLPLDSNEGLDTDGDGIGDTTDNCITVKNSDQSNIDNDAYGDACDDDIDGDGITNIIEENNGTNPYNADSDNDGVNDKLDFAPLDNTEQIDSDFDGIGDNADNCSTQSNPDQANLDQDAFGDICDDDIDGDGISNNDEAIAGTDPLLEDTDGDGVNDKDDFSPLDINESFDTDNDGIADSSDNCPLLANPLQDNIDDDEFGDICDTDRDGDTISNTDEINLGTDPDLADSDSDNSNDNVDAFPNDSTRSLFAISGAISGVSSDITITLAGQSQIVSSDGNFSFDLAKAASYTLSASSQDADTFCFYDDAEYTATQDHSNLDILCVVKVTIADAAAKATDSNLTTCLNNIADVTYAHDVEIIDCNGTADTAGTIATIDGLEDFVNLEELSVAYNVITSIDIQNNKKLSLLNVAHNIIDSLSINQNTLLKNIDAANNSLTSLSLINNPLLLTIDISQNQIDNLSLSQQTSLLGLFASNNLLDTINLDTLNSLSVLDLSNNDLGTINLNNNPSLSYLSLNSCGLSDINLLYNTKLNSLALNSNSLNLINIEEQIELSSLDLSGNDLANVNLLLNTQLDYLNLSNNTLASVNIEAQTMLNYLDLSHNQLETIDIDEQALLTFLKLNNNLLESINTNNQTELSSIDMSFNSLPSANVTANTKLTYLNLNNNDLTSIPTGISNIVDLDANILLENHSFEESVTDALDLLKDDYSNLVY